MPDAEVVVQEQVEAYNGRHARQRLTGQTRIVAALDARGALDTDLGHELGALLVAAGRHGTELIMARP